ncbi:hypothetical protein VaNZ11_002899 [Volvox africanus]|uniref:RING-type domain-containing protein n=1 Tax=Volvox africanus TaxID=51714 RepID=A0ABQ5RT19_9CHLO|nr:hypothetical protein VaNZ11_002899 [Volvox africanus]
MAVSDVKQICSICTEEVTDAEYRRELTCSYAACPAKEHAYHEDCVTKHLRKLRAPTDQLIGYQCPGVLDNGKPCSGRITGTHHRQPVNHKKKQKRVEAAAAAANVTKKPAVSKPTEIKLCVAAATAAMRPPGDGGVVVPLGSVKPAIPSVKVVAPGSGPAARLKSTAFALANNNTMMPERVVRQHLVPGWSVPEKISKEDRAKIAALQAEAKAAAGRGTKVQSNTQYTQAGQAPPKTKANKDDFRAYKFPWHRRVSDDGSSSVSSDTHPFNRYLRDEIDSEDDSTTFPNFFLVQEDFPAFPATNAASKCTTITAVPGIVGSNLELRTGESSPLPSDGSLVSPPTSLPRHELEMQLTETKTNTPATPAEDKEDDPVVHYDQLHPTVDGRFAVMDVYGNFIYMEDVYGQNPEVKGFDDGTGVITYYVLIRYLMLKATQEAATVQEAVAGQQAASAAIVVDLEGGAPVITENANVPLSSSIVVPSCDLQALEHATMRNELDLSFKVTDKIASQGAPNVMPLVRPNDTFGNGDQADDLNDLLALCLVRAPSPDLKPLHFANQPPEILSATATQHGCGLMGVYEDRTVIRAGVTVNSLPTVTAGGEMADDVDSLMQLLRV